MHKNIIYLLISLCVVITIINILNPVLYRENHNKNLVSKLKLNYDYLQDRILDYMDKENSKELQKTKLFSKLQSRCTSSTDANPDNCKNFLINFEKVFGKTTVVKTTEYYTKYLKDENTDKKRLYEKNAIVLNTGAYLLNYGFYPDTVKSANKNIVASFDIDVNGENQPNVFGRDIFRFIIDTSGNIIPATGNVNYREECSKQDYKENDYKMSGTTCAARIMADKWKMKY